MSVDNHTGPVLFFDGYCNLCNGLVQFIIRYDRQKLFRFAPLQSEAGVKAIAAVGASEANRLDSLILLTDDKYFVRSEAALRIAGLLGGIWRLLGAGYILPRFIRDAIYNFIARNRYRWFGKKAQCSIPTAATADRFIAK